MVDEFQENGGDVAGHGDIHVPKIVVPGDCEPELLVSYPIDGDGLYILKGLDEMLCILLVCEFETEVIDD